MKSVIHEASSLAKAIEEGWKKAGNPQEFRVKIFQDAKTSLFGLVVNQKAKIGIFFEENTSKGFSKEKVAVQNQLRPLNGKRPERRYEKPRTESKPNIPKQDFKERAENKQLDNQQAQQKIEPVVSEAKSVTEKKVINAFAKKVNE